MRYAVFSDIHGNQEALLHMLLQLRKGPVDGYIFCGDIMGYYYDQEAVIQQLGQLDNLILVSGNHDRYYLEAALNKKKAAFLCRRYGKSYEERISDRGMAFLQQMPVCARTVIQGRRIAVFHGGPGDYLEERIYPDTVTRKEEFEGWDVVFLGHTHYRMERKAGSTLIVNPGSLGQPRDGRGYSYCVFDFEKMENIFYNVSVDENYLAREMETRRERPEVLEYLRSRMEIGK